MFAAASAFLKHFIGEVMLQICALRFNSCSLTRFTLINGYSTNACDRWGYRCCRGLPQPAYHPVNRCPIFSFFVRR